MTKYIIIMQARTPLLLCTTRWSFLHQHGRGTAELQAKHTNTSKLINCQKEASRKRNREMWKEERTDDVFFCSGQRRRTTDECKHHDTPIRFVICPRIRSVPGMVCLHRSPLSDWAECFRRICNDSLLQSDVEECVPSHLGPGTCIAVTEGC